MLQATHNVFMHKPWFSPSKAWRKHIFLKGRPKPSLYHNLLFDEQIKQTTWRLFTAFCLSHLLQTQLAYVSPTLTAFLHFPLLLFLPFYHPPISLLLCLFVVFTLKQNKLVKYQVE
jgi:hypothetical protein